MKYLIIFRVDNVKEYDRHTFDNYEPEDVLDAFEELPEDEWRMYELATGYSTKTPSLSDFVEDYNNEDFDFGSWWMIIVETKE